jgi:hypothetical protein
MRSSAEQGVQLSDFHTLIPGEDRLARVLPAYC